MSIVMAATMQMLQETSMEKNVDSDPWHVQGVIMEDSSNDDNETIVSSIKDSDDSVTSSSYCSSDSVEDDDASSSATPSPASTSFGPLFELSELMAQLPIKRGISKYYHGKSQSFTSLASARNLGDLAKKGGSYNQRMKSCRSYGWGLDGRKYGPKATITKKSSKGAFISSLGSTNTSAATPVPSISIEKSF